MDACPKYRANAGVCKKMRKGTKSCMNCRQRKSRCSGTSRNTTTCAECAARDINCLPQGIVEDVGDPASDPLKARIAVLESRLEQLLGQPNVENIHVTSPWSSFDIERARLQDKLCTSKGACTCADQAEEERLETTGAPLNRLLSNSTVKDTPVLWDARGATQALLRAGMGSSQHSPQALKYRTAVHDLRSAFPSEAEMHNVFDNQSSWWLIFRDTEGLFDCAPEGDSLRSFGEYALRNGHPAMLGLLLACFAISTGEHRKYLPMVETHVLNDDEYASTESGLMCLMALAMCYICALQPRRAWTVFRRANTLLQLNGMHQSRTTQKQDRMFWALYHAERWVSVMTGLPYMMLDHLCDLTIPSCGIIPPLVFLNRHLSVITGDVINLLQDSQGPTLSGAARIEERIEYITAQVPRGYLNVGEARTSTNAKDRCARMYRIFQIYQLRSYIYLPFFFRSEQEPRFESSRKSCINDSRGAVDTYLDIYDTDFELAGNGTVLNFNAFTSVVVLLLNLIRHGTRGKIGRHTSPEANQDLVRFHRVKSALANGAENKMSGLLCRKCHQALKSLLFSASSTEGALDTIILPYFGTVVLRPTSSRAPQTFEGQLRQDQYSSVPPAVAVVSAPRVSEVHNSHLGLNCTPGGIDLDAGLELPTSSEYDGPFITDDNAASWLPNGDNPDLPAEESASVWTDAAGLSTDWSWLDVDLPPHITF